MPFENLVTKLAIKAKVPPLRDNEPTMKMVGAISTLIVVKILGNFDQEEAPNN